MACLASWCFNAGAFAHSYKRNKSVPPIRVNPFAVAISSNRPAFLCNIARVLSAQVVSCRTPAPIICAGPEIAQGPSKLSSRFINAGCPMAKPSRNPARPQNFPKPFSTMTLSYRVKSISDLLGVKSQKLSSITTRLAVLISVLISLADRLANPPSGCLDER